MVGPGCSSTFGLFWENGPIAFASDDKTKDYQFQSNPFSWNEAANVLYVEQPIRTGFSLAAADAHKIKTEEEIGRDFFSFMKSFLSVFTELADAEVFITGESYAGFYIPYMAQEIVAKQLDYFEGDRSEPYVNLKGRTIIHRLICTKSNYSHFKILASST